MGDTKIKGFDPSLPLQDKQEKFCNLIVNSGGSISPSKAAFLAGYGREKGHLEQDYLHNALGKRLMANSRISARIQFLREQLAKSDDVFVKTLINKLKDIVMSDCTEYIESTNYVNKEGATKTTFYYNRAWSQIPNHWKQTFVDGFDNQGRPKLISKTFAIEKLLKIYGIDKDNEILDDLASAFSSAGLSLGVSSESDVEAEIDEYLIEGINNAVESSNDDTDFIE